MTTALRHFLDLNLMPAAELRGILDASVVMKKKRKAQAKPDKPLENKTIPITAPYCIRGSYGRWRQQSASR